MDEVFDLDRRGTDPDEGGRLPNLLIAGVPKAGTSSLFRYLEQHPDICAASAKEIRYFKPLQEDRRLESLDSYRRWFAHCCGQRYAMEATPMYSYGGRRIVTAIRDTLDNPRIAISLREPVDRLWSAYTFQRTKGHLKEVPSFEAYLAICERKYREPDIGFHFRGIEISLYGDYLADWFAIFGDNVKVVFTDHLFRNPKATVVELCRWLGVDHEIADSFDYGVRNKTAHAKSIAFSRKARSLKRAGDRVLRRYPPLAETLRKAYVRINTGQLEEKLTEDTRRRLEERFRESNAAVARLLRSRGYESLPAWLTSAATADRLSSAT
jgi:hypothetical protein